MSRLVWDHIEEGLWQAGGLSSLFTIDCDPAGDGFALERTHDGQTRQHGSFPRLIDAQNRAQEILDGKPLRAPPAPDYGPPIRYDLN